jgi:nitroreductase
MTDFFEVLFAQRAHRALRPDPVPDALIERLLDAAIRAPSAENRQPWVFVVVRDPAQRDRIATPVREFWETVARDLARPHLSDWLYADVDRWATSGLAQAPVIVVVCGDTALCMEAALPSSIFPATQNLLLAAQALGLGALLSILPVVSGPRLAELLELPEHIVPMAAVPIGWPARRLGPSRRIPFQSKTFRDRYGDAW